MSNVVTPEMQSRIAMWRARTAAGEKLSLEEMRDAIRFLRAGRLAAATESKPSRSKKPSRSGDDLLADFEGS